MDPVKFRGHSKVIGAPQNWDHAKNGECIGLPVQIAGSAVLSVWSFTDEERRLIAEGADLVVSVFTGVPTQPPIGFTVQKIDRCEYPILGTIQLPPGDTRDTVLSAMISEGGLVDGEDFHLESDGVIISTARAWEFATKICG